MANDNFFSLNDLLNEFYNLNSSNHDDEITVNRTETHYGTMVNTYI